MAAAATATATAAATVAATAAARASLLLNGCPYSCYCYCDCSVLYCCCCDGDCDLERECYCYCCCSCSCSAARATATRSTETAAIRSGAARFFLWLSVDPAELADVARAKGRRGDVLSEVMQVGAYRYGGEYKYESERTLVHVHLYVHSMHTRVVTDIYLYLCITHIPAPKLRDVAKSILTYCSEALSCGWQGCCGLHADG